MVLVVLVVLGQAGGEFDGGSCSGQPMTAAGIAWAVDLLLRLAGS